MSHKQKHVPQRTCVICRQKFDKRSLTRLVRTPEGIFVDATGKREGRGAYLCDNPDCYQRAASTNLLSKALRTDLTVEDRQRILDVAP